MHGRHNLYFLLHVHGRIHFYRRPHAAVRQQVVPPGLHGCNAVVPHDLQGILDVVISPLFLLKALRACREVVPLCSRSWL